MTREEKMAAPVTQEVSSHYPPELAALETSQEEGEKSSSQLRKTRVPGSIPRRIFSS